MWAGQPIEQQVGRGEDVSRRGMQTAIEIWKIQEEACGNEGIWAEYKMCTGCLKLFRGSWHTDEALVKHTGGDLGALAYWDRQRVTCADIIGRCSDCFNHFSRTGTYAREAITQDGALWVMQWVNAGGVMGLL